ncbi:hypothetical protein [Staphylococcus capitis]|nr:hypothetical protein [Staphylococcus capitis]
MVSYIFYFATEPYSLSQDQAIKFNSHLHHEYLNASEKTISFISILHYKM